MEKNIKSIQDSLTTKTVAPFEHHVKIKDVYDISIGFTDGVLRLKYWDKWITTKIDLAVDYPDLDCNFEFEFFDIFKVFRQILAIDQMKRDIRLLGPVMKSWKGKNPRYLRSLLISNGYFQYVHRSEFDDDFMKYPEESLLLQIIDLEGEVANLGKQWAEKKYKLITSEDVAEFLSLLFPIIKRRVKNAK